MFCFLAPFPVIFLTKIVQSYPWQCAIDDTLILTGTIMPARRSRYMEAEWRKAMFRFILNNIGQLDQDEFDSWADDDFDLAPLLVPFLKTMSVHRDRILAEMHQMFPSEVFDRFKVEHPEIAIDSADKVIFKIGKELEAIKSIVSSL